MANKNADTAFISTRDAFTPPLMRVYLPTQFAETISTGMNCG